LAKDRYNSFSNNHKITLYLANNIIYFINSLKHIILKLGERLL